MPLVLAAVLLAGTATWYPAQMGHAAAGPALRAALGPSWRGRAVLACHRGRCARVRLTDWCQCLRSTASERVIDLSDDDFARLGVPLSRGIARVVIIIGTRVFTPPASAGEQTRI